VIIAVLWQCRFHVVSRTVLTVPLRWGTGGVATSIGTIRYRSRTRGRQDIHGRAHDDHQNSRLAKPHGFSKGTMQTRFALNAPCRRWNDRAVREAKMRSQKTPAAPWGIHHGMRGR
jgi:hypothetical protein